MSLPPTVTFGDILIYTQHETPSGRLIVMFLAHVHPGSRKKEFWCLVLRDERGLQQTPAVRSLTTIVPWQRARPGEPIQEPT
jgi:hypothetical protein